MRVSHTGVTMFLGILVEESLASTGNIMYRIPEEPTYIMLH